MRAIVMAILLGLFATAGQAESPPLKRLTLRQDLLGFEAVGRLEIGAKGYCTGTLIAPDLVLTAAHCLMDTGGRARVDPGRLRFRAGLRDGVSVAERAVARGVVHPSYDPAASEAADRIRHDVALVELAEPIPAAIAAPFRVAALDRGAREVSVVSFASGRDEALSRQRSCGVIGRGDDLMAFDCDVDFGASGAPVFDRTGGRPVIVAIISAGRREAGETVSFGMALIGPVADLRAALRTGRGIVGSGTAPAIRPRRIGPGTAAAPDGPKFVRP